MVPAADDQLELEEKLFERSEDFETRRPKQIDVPAFPTTTIGSFPQTNGAPRHPLLEISCLKFQSLGLSPLGNLSYVPRTPVYHVPGPECLRRFFGWTEVYCLVVPSNFRCCSAMY